jgi:hypothetical protein
MLFSISTKAQNTEKKITTEKIAEEDEGLLVLKFEPDFISQNEKKKSEIAQTKRIIEALTISDRKRLKLLKDLYKKGISKRLEKAMLVDNTYEDIEE